MSLITHNSAGQLANNDKLCVDILNSTKCADTTGCQYFHTNDHDWIKADGCHAVCYSQDVKLKECTDANAATILCLLGGVLNFLMGVFNFGTSITTRHTPHITTVAPHTPHSTRVNICPQSRVPAGRGTTRGAFTLRPPRSTTPMPPTPLARAHACVCGVFADSAAGEAVTVAARRARCPHLNVRCFCAHAPSTAKGSSSISSRTP